MKEKLILHDVMHCPFCWKDLMKTNIYTLKKEQGFFTHHEMVYKCPECGASGPPTEAVFNKEPQPALWARRFNEVMK